jgi:F0F1-type ATP synthase membrane subunit b/b'
MRDAFEAKRERIRADLSNAREKASQWQARARDFERQLTELENTEILRMVHSVASSPEELRGLLDLIQSAREPSQTNLIDQKEV